MKRESQSRVIVFGLCAIALSILTAAGSVVAVTAQPDEMRQVAENWVSQYIHATGSWGDYLDARIDGAEDMVVGGLLIGRCYSVDPLGFVIVPVLKEMAPVKAFSYENGLDPNKATGLADMIRGQMHAIALDYIARYGGLDAEQPAVEPFLQPLNVAERWQRLAVDGKAFGAYLEKASNTRTMVGPLLTVHWHQYLPFNALCPPGTPVGCVATAAAQIMQYWQWPDEGIGSHSYWWDGDGGPGAHLSAEFWDSYHWENMPDGCAGDDCGNPVFAAELAEFNYEVAVAFEMDFGVDGSGISITEVTTVVVPQWRDHFVYKYGMVRRNRPTYTPTTWWNLIQAEVDAGRPLEYFMRSHAVVCDGWSDVGGTMNIHLNYGWDSGHNSWYEVDNIFQPDPDGEYTDEFVLRYIEPDLSAVFSTEDRFGWAPHEAFFQCSSEFAFDQVAWNFGDGGDGDTDTCTHIYTESGVFDVSLLLNPGSYSRSKANYVVVLADSLYGDTLVIDPGITNEMIVRATTAIPLSELIIPVTFAGSLNINPYTVTWNTTGCATAGMDIQSQTNYDPYYRRMTFKLANSGESSDLAPGVGQPVLKIQFDVDGTPESGDNAPFSFAPYASNAAHFKGQLAEYDPVIIDGLAHLGGCCEGIRGDINYDGNPNINIEDLVYLVLYMFQDGPDPECWDEANVNGDILDQINIEDLVHLVLYMFQDGPEPAPCP